MDYSGLIRNYGTTKGGFGEYLKKRILAKVYGHLKGIATEESVISGIEKLVKYKTIKKEDGDKLLKDWNE